MQLAPLASNASELIASFGYALKKTSKSITISLTALEGAGSMNNTFTLGVFMALIYTQARLACPEQCCSSIGRGNRLHTTDWVYHLLYHCLRPIPCPHMRAALEMWICRPHLVCANAMFTRMDLACAKTDECMWMRL